MSVPDSAVPVTAAATFCATLADEWVRAGVTEVVVAPGSRSTPLALALAADGRMRVSVAHDERVAGFMALGCGLATGRPAVVVCTSGTAAAHLHAAVIEADLSSVPMIVCTADRPPELWDVGAAQTVDQTHLYGRSVRFFSEPGVPDAAFAATWRSLAARLVLEASGASGRPGPVHANLAFRDPLAGLPDEPPPGRPGGAPWHGSPAPASVPDAGVDAAAVLDVIGDRTRGVIVAGHGASDPAAVLALGEAWGWPVIADPRSGCRRPGSPVVAFADAVLRAPTVAPALAPEVVLRFGEPPASKVLAQWLAGSGAPLVVARGRARWSDPERRAAAMVDGRGLAAALAGVGRPRPDGWLRSWLRCDAVAAAVIDRVLGAGPELTEPAVARAVTDAVPDGGGLVVSSSMPVRDVEWFGAVRPGIEVHSNRGANGIDGVVATAIGVALASRRPTCCLIGDVALLHDSSALAALARRSVDLAVVVVDNDGGGIFSFLPQATSVDVGRFEELFGTPHGTDLVALARAHGLSADTLASADAIRAFVAGGGGPRVGVVRTGTRSDNVAGHRRLNDAVVAALAGMSPEVS